MHTKTGSDETFETFFADIREGGPTTLTILPTYRCSAACAQCCFGSNPHVQGQLPVVLMKRAVDEAIESFPRLKVLVLSGGECFLLGQELWDVIAHATKCGLLTRVVSNGFWAKSTASARRHVDAAVDSGLSELNLSTGRDHAEFVPINAVLNAAEAAIDAGISTLITVEQDAADSSIFGQINADPRTQRLKRHSAFRLRLNSWMQFNDQHVVRTNGVPRSSVDVPCTQLFENLVITPSGKVASCCGLTFEYIPELALGEIQRNSLKAMYARQTDDFLKLWIRAEGPVKIVRSVLPARARELEACEHICQACAKMYRDSEIRTAIVQNYAASVPRVVNLVKLERYVEAKVGAKSTQAIRGGETHGEAKAT